MRFAFIITVVFASLFLLSAAAFGQQATPTVESLGWISGCWDAVSKNPDRSGSEQWMKPAGGTMIGMARTVKAGKTVSFEYLRIEQKGADIFYVSKPSQNSAETSFKLIRSAENEAVFENPTHDFPQRIIYRLNKTSLFARIEGVNEGKTMGIDFPMIKAECGN